MIDLRYIREFVQSDETLEALGLDSDWLEDLEEKGKQRMAELEESDEE